ncbi:hypothetical protein M0804_013876 [Polistes exclamans]|nr:hypothetical protein M0804_013876 [Polistes exclamans]
MIDKLTVYYGLAIGSWCSWQRVSDTNTFGSFKHDYTPLPSDVLSAMKPIYEDLSKERLLERCMKTGLNCHEYAQKMDENRILMAEKKSASKTNEARIRHRQKQKDILDIAAAVGSLLYGLGFFFP